MSANEQLPPPATDVDISIPTLPEQWPTLVGEGTESPVDNYHGMVRALQVEYGLRGNAYTNLEYIKQLEAGLFADKLLELVDERISDEERRGLYDTLLSLYGEGLAARSDDGEVPQDYKARFDGMLESHLGSQEAQDDLADIATQGERARTALVLGNLGLAASVAYRSLPPEADKAQLMDTITEANLGLMRAINTYDYTKGASFGTYAYTGIQLHLARAIPHSMHLVYVQPQIRSAIDGAIARVRSRTEGMSDQVVFEQIEAEIDKKISYKIGFRDYLNLLSHRIVSLDMPIDESGTTFNELIADDKAEDDVPDMSLPDDEVDDDTLYVRGLLNERQKKIVQLRYGSDMSLADIGQELGVTRQAIDQSLKQISKIVKKAFEPENIEDL